MKLLTSFWVAAGLAIAQPALHLSNFQQLTYGGQNAEAYWSPDGGRLVFQSTRDAGKCDQIYVMDADGGRKSGTSLTLIEGNQERADRERKVPASMNTFSLDYERKRNRDYSTEDLDIPTFLRRGVE